MRALDTFRFHFFLLGMSIIFSIFRIYFLLWGNKYDISLHTRVASLILFVMSVIFVCPNKFTFLIDLRGFCFWGWVLYGGIKSLMGEKLIFKNFGSYYATNEKLLSENPLCRSHFMSFACLGPFINFWNIWGFFQYICHWGLNFFL